MVIRALIVALVVGIAGTYAHRLATRSTSSHTIPDLTRLPSTLEGWTSQDHPLAENVAQVLDADAALQRRYRHRDGSEVWLYVAYFAQQTVNSQIHSPRQCVPGSGWRVVTLGQEALSLPSGPHAAMSMLVERNGERQQLLYWFRTRGGDLTGEYALKWNLLRNALAGRPTDALFVRYSAPAEEPEAMRDIMVRLDGPLSALQRQVGLR